MRTHLPTLLSRRDGTRGTMNTQYCVEKLRVPVQRVTLSEGLLRQQGLAPPAWLITKAGCCLQTPQKQELAQGKKEKYFYHCSSVHNGEGNFLFLWYLEAETRVVSCCSTATLLNNNWRSLGSGVFHTELYYQEHLFPPRQRIPS